MNGARLLTLLPTLHTRRPLTVIGAAVVDIIADAWTLPRRGGDIELQQQSVNVGGCALNIAVALKRLGIDAGNALPLGQGVWAERIRRRLAKEELSSVIDAVEGDNGWCLALVEPDGERTFMSFSGVENQWNADWLSQLRTPRGSLVYLSGYQLASSCGEPLIQWLETVDDVTPLSILAHESVILQTMQWRALWPAAPSSPSIARRPPSLRNAPGLRPIRALSARHG